MKNNGFISETYLKYTIKKTNMKNVKSTIDGIKLYFEDVRSHIEKNTSEDVYSLTEYVDDFMISGLGALFRYKEIENTPNKFALFVDSITDTPIGTLLALHYTDSLSCEKKGINRGFTAVKLAQNHKARWAFLTNGLVWRIYDASANSPFETYLEMDLTDLLISNNELNDDAIMFSIFCQGKSYYIDDQSSKSMIDSHFENSEKEIDKQEKALKDKIEKIVTDISYGFIQSIGKSEYTEYERRKIFEDSIILLYRMLFIQYAESRSLLPVENELYAENSFETLAEMARELYHSGNLANYNESFALWKRMDLLRGYINSGWDDIEMKAYNGGLFDNEHHHILNEYSISDSYFAEVLCELSYVKDKAGKYNERIEYKDLSVRNLGSLYEGLLEFNLFIAQEQLVRRTSKGKVTYIPTSETAVKQSERNSIISKGKIYLSQDALERKESGSYYTPEDVVNYIISNSVGKKLDEIKKDFDKHIEQEFIRLHTAINFSEKQAIQRDIDLKIKSFINERILTLSVLDCSMGSGHFLVNTVYFITNYIMEIVHSTDWESEYLNGDIDYWKIQVVSHCIFGIDINPLALHLGKLSLWLISAAKNKPLSFMDHHLKVGNSLIGIDKRTIQRQMDEWSQGEFDIFTIGYNNILDGVLKKYSEISQMPEETRDQVHAKKDLYEEINNEIDLLKKKYDVFLSMLQIDGKVKENSFIRLLSFDDTQMDSNFSDYEEYWTYAEKNQFFHWDLEFPDVIAKGGFDVVIGNPPYVMVTDQLPYLNSIKHTLQTNNLFSYMMERGIEHTRNNGHFGMIVPISAVSVETMMPLQKFVLSSMGKLFVSNFSTRPSKLFHKVEQRLSIILGEKTDNKAEKEIYTTTYLKWYAYERKILFSDMLKYTRCDFENIMDGIIPKIGSGIENNIFKKIRATSNRLQTMTDNNGEINLYYHRVPRYWNKAMDYIPGFVSEKQGAVQSSEYKIVCFNDKHKRDVFGCILNSSLLYWWFNVVTDCRHLSRRDIMDFKFDWQTVTEKQVERFSSIFNELMENFIENKKQITMNLGGQLGIVTLDSVDHQLSKPIIDKIDEILAEYYGFDEKELSFIQNFDNRFRMGDDNQENE